MENDLPPPGGVGPRQEGDWGPPPSTPPRGYPPPSLPYPGGFCRRSPGHLRPGGAGSKKAGGPHPHKKGKKKKKNRKKPPKRVGFRSTRYGLDPYPKHQTKGAGPPPPPPNQEQWGNFKVKMTFSGTLEPSTINLQPNTNTDEQNLAGNGTLGPFTFRELHADPAAPQPSSTCSPGNAPPRLYFPNVAGGGVFRFQDGSLLTVGVTAGSSICIDLTAGVAHLTTNYQITGGTGRFKGASGALTLTAMLTPVLFNASNGVVLERIRGSLREQFPEWP